jgi:16S rRNA (guanine1516-N2)-methyltransferase
LPYNTGAVNFISAKWIMNIQLFTPKSLSEKNQTKIEQLERTHQVTLVESAPADIFLLVEDGKVGLANSEWPKVSPVFVDFVSGSANHRRLHGGGKSQAVAKAVGLNKRKDLTVLDATAGLGRDAFVLASLGASVHMHERHPIVHLLLQDGLQRLKETDDDALQCIAQRMQLHHGCFQDADFGGGIDVVYLDPMFPVREKSAKIKKDMAMFHTLVGLDDDADELLSPALEVARHRVAVKRPKGAPFLSGLAPALSLDGKSNRFDIYTKQAL